MRRAKVSMVFDKKGGFLIESSNAAARIYASETDDGGLYFEVAMERGGRLYGGDDPKGRSKLCTVSPAAREDAATEERRNV